MRKRGPVIVDLDRVRELAASGLGVKGIAQQLGVNRCTLAMRMKAEGITPDPALYAAYVSRRYQAGVEVRATRQPAREAAARQAVAQRIADRRIAEAAPVQIPPDVLLDRDILATGGRYACLAAYAAARRITTAEALRRWHQVRAIVAQTTDRGDE